MDAGMYAARQRHQKRASFIVAQKAARLARWLERRTRTAEPSAGLMAVRSQPHTKHRTYDGGKATPSEESARWRRGKGSTTWCWLARALMKDHARLHRRCIMTKKDFSEQ